MLSLAELERAARAIATRYTGLRLDRIALRGVAGIALGLSGRPPGASQSAGAEAVGRVKRRLVLDATPAGGYAGELAVPAPAADGDPEADAVSTSAGGARAPRAVAPPAFVQYLRAHLVGARCLGAEILGADRQLALRFAAREGERTLLLSLLGPRSNLWLLDAAGRVEIGLRPSEETRREMTRGTLWQPPSSGLPRRGEDRFASIADDALLETIATHYAARAASEGRVGLVRRLAAALERELRALTKREAELSAVLAQADAAPDLARQGELLKGALASVPLRAHEVVLSDPGTAERVTIALDPALSPAGNLERLFREHRRATKQRARAQADLAGVAARRRALTAQRAQLAALAADAGAEVTRFEALAAEPPLRDLLRRSGRQAPPREPPEPARKDPFAALPPRLRPQAYRSADGLEIWVGRSDEGNDHLSTRLARGSDLFLHVDGGAGSHVLLRLAGRDHAPQESLLDACELAVHFSKQRAAAAASVLVAPAKDVRKPRGAKPGLVEVRGGRVVRLRREPERLARLLATRRTGASA